MSGGRGLAALRAASLALGLGFLYLPIAVLIAYSFNGSRLVTIWGGFSTRWYGALIDDEKFITAALTSLKIAMMAASLALALGTAAGLAMNRFTRFRGRALFAFMLTAPLVVPEVILGLSLLLLFVAGQGVLGWPAERGVQTVTIAHATFAACFVAVLVRAQLAGFDRGLEEAALDLGARPWTVLWRITLAGDQPGARLGLAVGLHDVARRSGDREFRVRPGRDDIADGGVFERADRRDAGDQRAGDRVPWRRFRDRGARLCADRAP